MCCNICLICTAIGFPVFVWGPNTGPKVPRSFARSQDPDVEHGDSRPPSGTVSHMLYTFHEMQSLEKKKGCSFMCIFLSKRVRHWSNDVVLRPQSQTLTRIVSLPKVRGPAPCFEADNHMTCVRLLELTLGLQAGWRVRMNSFLHLIHPVACLAVRVSPS